MDGKRLPIMRRSFLPGKNKPCQSGGHSWAHGGNGHCCKMLETLATKSGQQRQCVLEILATVGSSWETKSVDCTLRVLLTKGTGCFYLLGSPASWDSCGEFPPVDEWIALLHWSRLGPNQDLYTDHFWSLIEKNGWLMGIKFSTRHMSSLLHPTMRIVLSNESCLEIGNTSWRSQILWPVPFIRR